MRDTMIMATSTKFMIIALLAGGALLAAPRIEAQQVEAFDRALAERMIRALEAQAHATEAQVHATEALTRAAERCK
jgi:hypothetical protein